MANSYIAEHMNDKGLYELFVCKLENNLIQVKVSSRHESDKKHKLWIEYSAGENSVTGWYCKCKTGARTVGCCAHIASAILHLAYYRHQGNRQNNTSRSFGDFINDAAVVVDFDLEDADGESEADGIDIDSSEEDSSDRMDDNDSA